MRAPRAPHRAWWRRAHAAGRRRRLSLPCRGRTVAGDDDARRRHRSRDRGARAGRRRRRAGAHHERAQVGDGHRVARQPGPATLDGCVRQARARASRGASTADVRGRAPSRALVARRNADEPRRDHRSRPARRRRRGQRVRGSVVHVAATTHWCRESSDGRRDGCRARRPRARQLRPPRRLVRPTRRQLRGCRVPGGRRSDALDGRLCTPGRSHPSCRERSGVVRGAPVGARH